MLNCGLCDYYKTVNSNSKKRSICMCEFTGFVFHKEPEEYEVNNHPCYDYEANKVAAKVEKVILVSESEVKTA